MAKKKSFENIISNLLGEPVSNLCHAFYDQYVEANVKFRSKAGMKTVIIRRQLGKCCSWCADLAGIYTPEKAPADIYRRHDNCKCMVTYKDENGYTDAWSKKEFQTQKRARIEKEHDLLKTNKPDKLQHIQINLKDKDTKYAGLKNIVYYKTGDKTIAEYVSSKKPLGNFFATPADRVVTILRKQSREWIDTLTEYEKKIIRKYTYNSNDNKGNELYRRLNAMLRGELPKDEKLQGIANTLSNAINKSKLDCDVICYRSVDIPAYINRSVGEVFKDPQFISTSVRKNGALTKPFKIIIYAKKGTRAAYIEELSKYKKQRELLIDKDTVFRVLSKSKDEIRLEVIK